MKFVKKIKKKLRRLYKAVFVLMAIIAVAYGYYEELFTDNNNADLIKQNEAGFFDSLNNADSITNVPEYTGEPYITINENEPFFQDADMTSDSFEYYSKLDSLGRCGVCIASIGKDIMPTERRTSIGMVKPSGWHTVRYDDLVDGKYLYNRCHLIGFQLAGENANTLNLITGTRYLNNEGMLPFENLVADYVKRTNNHVMYRVTPIFIGDDLVVRGVNMEAKSVEDDGAGIKFNVYCYNVQPGIAINYQTGESERI
ncbi:MAG: DNA/RNA non-specific endonuclease [Eubacteriales bacterium]